MANKGTIKVRDWWEEGRNPTGIRFSVSDALDWMRCQQYWWYKHKVRRGPRPTEAMEEGTARHQWIAEGLRGKGWGGGAVPSPGEVPTTSTVRTTSPADRPYAIAAAASKNDPRSVWAQYPLRDPHVDSLDGALVARKLENVARKLENYEVIDVEVALEAPLGNHTLLGTPDAVLRHTNGIYYSGQWKTCASNRSLDSLMDEVRSGWHEAAYEYLIKFHYCPSLSEGRFGGTVLGVWKKLTRKQIAEGMEPFTVVPLSRTAAEVDRALGELIAIADQMQRAMESNLQRNRRSCIQFNSRCPYFGVCHGGAALSDERFVDVEDRYTNVP